VQGAADDADQALSLASADAQAHHLRALAAVRQLETPIALAHLDLAARFGFPPAATAETRCDVHTQAGEYATAEQTAREWRRLDPKSVPAARRYGVLLRLLGRDEDADRAIEQAAVLAGVPLPGEWTSHILDMTVYTGPQMTAMLCGRYLDRIPSTQFQRAFAYASRGEARRHSGMGEEGFNDFCTAVRLHPGFAPIRMVRATEAFHRKQYHIALEDAEALIRLTPTDPAARKLHADTRAAIRMSADFAGRAPDFRPPGPLVQVPITVSAPRVLAAEYGEGRRGDVR
jgi:tetratricopeptide (TPR) repeat protein